MVREGGARLLLAARASGQVQFIIDRTQVSFQHQLLMVVVAYHGRALAIAWAWDRSGRGQSSQHKQLALLAAVRDLFPTEVRANLSGDTEFGHTLVLEYLDHWGWDYALRQAGHYQVWPPRASDWQRLDTLAPAPDE